MVIGTIVNRNGKNKEDYRREVEERIDFKIKGILNNFT